MLSKEKLFCTTSGVCFFAMICCLLWGSAFPCVKIGYQMFGIGANDWKSQILFAGTRFFLAGILVVIIASIQGRHFVRVASIKELKYVIRLSLFQTILQYFFFYIGLGRTSGVKASIIEGTNVFVAIVVAAGIFRLEKVTVQKMIGCIVGFAGVVLVNYQGNGFDFSMSLTGEGFIFISTIAYAFSSVLLKYASKEASPVMLSGYQFIFGGLVMIIFGVGTGGTMRPEKNVGLDIAMLFYLALISAVAYSLWGLLLKYNEVSKVAVFGFMNPVFGVLLSSWWLREYDLLGVHSILALILVCVGIYYVNHKEGTRKKGI